MDAPRLEPGMRVLVAGASGGMGREVLRFLAASPVKVGAHHFRGRAALDAALEGLRGPAAFKTFRADLSRAEGSRKLVADFVRWAGGIDVLIQLSGGMTPADPARLTPAQWRADLELNLTAPFFLARDAMAHMPKEGGRVVLTGTASASSGGGPTTVAYGVAKAGVECAAKALARMGASRRILVNAVSPGFIDTEFHAVRARRTPEQLAARVARVPLGRAGTPSEVAAAIVFLASRHGGFITGQTLKIDGGDFI